MSGRNGRVPMSRMAVWSSAWHPGVHPRTGFISIARREYLSAGLRAVIEALRV